LGLMSTRICQSWAPTRIANNQTAIREDFILRQEIDK
jgi:hypothetical protein